MIRTKRPALPQKLKGDLIMSESNRFEVIQSEGNSLTSSTRQILLDTATGVQYLFVRSGYAGGLCPLLDKDGKPLSWDV